MFKILIIEILIVKSFIEDYVEVSLIKAFIIIRATSNNSPVSVIDRSKVFLINK